MMRAAVCLIATLALSGCASLGKTKAPVCNGEHRRPANLYGSVLDPSAPPQAGASAPVADAEKLSALPVYGSCRG